MKINFILQSPESVVTSPTGVGFCLPFSHLSHILILLFTICRHLPDNAERQEVRTECEHDGDSCDAIAHTANRQSFAQPGTIHDTARGEFASLQWREEAAKQFLNWIVDTRPIEAKAI